MQGLSWGQILLTVISSIAAVWLAAYLKAKQVTFRRIYSFCILATTAIFYIILIFPKSETPPERCWVEIGIYCLPPPWALLIGFAFGNLIAFALWLGMQQKR